MGPSISVSQSNWRRFVLRLFLVVVQCWMAASVAGAADLDSVGVWEKVEIVLTAEESYENPYADVTVWVDLKGPGFEKRCYGFWDGGRTFRIRVMGTKPGQWTWESGSEPGDAGLSGVSGGFKVRAWSEEEIAENPCRRGMIRPTRNGHAFEHADGTPYFLLGDTWWAIPTSRYRWYDDDLYRPLGPEAGFKDLVRYRVRQGYNCLAMIAAFPHWFNDDKPAGWEMPDGTVVRSAWRQAGTDSAKTMVNEAGERPFLFPGKVEGYEQYIPDLERINPEYFKTMDRKIDYLNSQGIVPFIEVARRDIGQVWKKYYPWPDSYTRYIQYVWSRYQANICLLSPIHFDTPGKSIGVEDWNAAANKVIEDYGPPPFGTLTGTNANPSSLVNWGHVDKAKWLRFHQIGNRRTHDCYAYMTEIFEAEPAVPGINGEPYYDGMEDAEPGSELAALYCRSAMYGSVLSGGLGGHIYGAGGWKGGMWSGEVEEASEYPIWDVIQWESADQMRHLRTFIMSEGRRYQDLEPATELVEPNKSSGPKTNVGWAYCARTKERDLFMLYFERDCPQAVLSGATVGASYGARWFDPRQGRWLESEPGIVTADSEGRVRLPAFPDGKARCGDDWALKLVAATASVTKELMKEFQNCKVVPKLGNAWDYMFEPGEMPKLEWDRPEVVREVMGDFELKARWFDGQLKEVARAEEPGRYAFYVEGRTPDGRVVRRASTVYCRPKSWFGWSERPVANLEFIPVDGVTTDAWKDRQEAISVFAGRTVLLSMLSQQEGAVLLSYLQEMKAGGNPGDLTYTPIIRDHDYHLALKRRILGIEDKYPELRRPRRVTGDEAPVLHAGTERQAGFRRGTARNIRRVCQEWFQESGEPFVMLVARRGVVIVHEPFGDWEWGRLNRNTPTEMASLTKLVTGLMFAQFADQGLIDIDDPVGKYLPDFPTSGEKVVTLRQCFTHTTGLYGHEEYGGLHNPWMENVIANGIEHLSPGRVHEYNGMGYDLAGKVMEAVSGKSIFRLMRENLFDPLGFEHTTLEEDLGFSCFSTAGEFARFGQLLLNRGSYGDMEFFSPETFERILPKPLSQYYPGIDKDWGIGLTWMRQRHPEAGKNGVADDATILSRNVIGHGSATSAILRVDLDNKLVIAQSRRRGGPEYGKHLVKLLTTIEQGLK